ncbi:uncharacterized protein LOC143296196 [Babylonia areolata]|uniref:uncharacterized protein LOC143296196 n=1 Tax=Babylonia areolata TaxID=304850 RepID=UPI003FD14B2E
MGCQGSKSGQFHPLSDDDKVKVRESWQWFMEDEHINLNTGLIFIKLFELAPDSKKLFIFGNDDSREAMLEDPRLQAHCRRIADALSLLVDKLYDQEAVTKTITNLGGRHIAYGTKERHIPAAAEGVMCALKAALQTRFTPEHEKAWTSFLGMFGALFIQGMKEKRKGNK